MNEDCEFILAKISAAAKGIIRIKFEPRKDISDWKDPTNCWSRLLMTESEAKDIIIGLTESEFIEKKRCNNPHGGDWMYIFNHNHEGTMLFIKVSWKEKAGVIVLSFHELNEPEDIS